MSICLLIFYNRTKPNKQVLNYWSNKKKPFEDINLGSGKLCQTLLTFYRPNNQSRIQEILSTSNENNSLLIILQRELQLLSELASNSSLMFDLSEICELTHLLQLPFTWRHGNSSHKRIFVVTDEAEKVIAMPPDSHEHTSQAHENRPLVDIFRSAVDGSDRCTVEVQARV